MQIWEYALILEREGRLYLQFPKDAKPQPVNHGTTYDLLNEVGANGFELIAITPEEVEGEKQVRLLLKRPKQT